MLSYIRIACAVPEVQVANVEKNAQDICGYMTRAHEENVDVLLLPELSLTGYSCGDLFLQDALLDAALADYVEPVPGAKMRVKQVLRIMLTAWLAARMRQQAENMVGELACQDTLKGV